MPWEQVCKLLRNLQKMLASRMRLLTAWFARISYAFTYLPLGWLSFSPISYIAYYQISLIIGKVFKAMHFEKNAANANDRVRVLGDQLWQSNDKSGHWWHKN